MTAAGTRALPRTLVGHTGPVTACAIAADGSFIASASADGTVNLWEARSGSALRRFETDRGPVRTCAIDPRGSFVASGYDDGTLMLWAVRMGSGTRTLEGHRGPVGSCTIDPRGLVVVTGSDDGTVKIWDAQAGSALRTLEGHGGPVRACAIEPGGSFIVSGSDDGTLMVWDAQTGSALRTLAGHNAPVRTCVISGDGSLVVSGDQNGEVRLWQVQTGYEMSALARHDAPVRACAISGDGSLVVSGAQDGTVELWDAQVGSMLRSLARRDAPIRACAFVVDDLLVVSGGEYGVVQVGAERFSTTTLSLAHRLEAFVETPVPDPDPVFVREVRRQVEETLRRADKGGRRDLEFARRLSDDEALRLYFETTLTAAEEAGDRVLAGSALSQLASVYARLGEPAEALRSTHRAIAVAEEARDLRTVEGALRTAALLYAGLGEPEEAMRHSERALEIARRIGDLDVQHAALLDLGSLHSRLGHDEEAVSNYREALTIARETGDPRAEDLILRRLDELEREQDTAEEVPSTDVDGLPPDPVDCTVFAPPHAPRAQEFLVQVFAHIPEHAKEAEKLAKKVDPGAKWRNFKSLETAIPRGSRLTFELSMRGLEIQDPLQSLIWNGTPEAVEFDVLIPADRLPGAAIGKVTVLLDSFPVGYIRFQVDVTLHPFEAAPEMQPTGDGHRYRMAFVSYASEDRDEVLARVQMLKLIRVPFFQDVLSLDPGDRWRKKLYRHIDECDLFLLFWSSNAKRSKWVRRESRRALHRKLAGGDAKRAGRVSSKIRYRLARDFDDLAPPEICPVVIEGPPVPLPWREFKEVQFADPLIHLWKGSSSGAGKM